MAAIGEGRFCALF